MILELNQETRDRVNKAIGNIRLIATRVKRASVLDATQRAENVVSMLNEFRQYLNLNEKYVVPLTTYISFKHDTETAQRLVQAIMQADDVYNTLPRAKKKSYEQEYTQVWKLLEEIHTYLLAIIEKGVNHAAQ